jgi:signal transduction histidine kinase/CheY-like chemotaxis protein
MLVASIYTAVLIRDRQRAFGEVSRYNITWVTSQAALEVARLESAVRTMAMAGPGADPTQVQIRFDIVANRVQILGHGDAGKMIHSQAELGGIYQALQTAMAYADRLLDRLDQPGNVARLAAIIAPLGIKMARLAGAAHDMGGNLVAEDLDQLRTLHYVFSGMLMAVIACCTGLIGVLAINNRMLTVAHRNVGALVVDLRRTGRELSVAHDATRISADEIRQQNRTLQARDHELALQNTRFDAALNNMSQALCMVGPDNRLIVCNQQFRELFNIEPPPTGMPVASLFDDIIQAGRADPLLVRRVWQEQQALVDQADKGGFVVQNDELVAGQMSALAVAHQPMPDGGWVATYSDITDRKLADEGLAQAQKMEAIGNLTGGMAHDFNNLLAVISLNLEQVLGRTDQPEAVDKHASRALQASLRGATLISQLLAFARRQPLAPQRISVNKWIGAIASLLEHTLGEGIRIHLELGADIWPVNADATRLETAIANLATNARDAMPNGGTLTIITRNCRLTTADMRTTPDAKPGDYVLIEVADTGTGMAPQVVSHIFEPFFTTKDEGQGTGLGLSMVFGFIRQSGGHIVVDSAPGQGTVFRLYLPRADGVVAPEPEPAAPSEIRGGCETILVVEDNEGVRLVTTELLSQLGYRIIGVDNPQDAMQLIKANPGIDLVFSDVVMPGGMDGFALVKQARAFKPALKVLLTSGYSEFGNRPGNDAAVRVLGKPFRQSQLAHTLREILDA